MLHCRLDNGNIQVHAVMTEYAAHLSWMNRVRAWCSCVRRTCSELLCAVWCASAERCMLCTVRWLSASSARRVVSSCTVPATALSADALAARAASSCLPVSASCARHLSLSLWLLCILVPSVSEQPIVAGMQSMHDTPHAGDDLRRTLAASLLQPPCWRPLGTAALAALHSVPAQPPSPPASCSAALQEGISAALLPSAESPLHP